MKLKDRPLDYWPGKRFTYWCRADRNDERKIHYTLHASTFAGETVHTFTSQEPVDPIIMHRVRNSTILKLELIDNEWYVSLVY